MQPQDPQQQRVPVDVPVQPVEPFLQPTDESFFEQQDSAYESQVVNQNQNDVIEWHASEYIQHEKSAMWYGILAAITLVIAAVLIVFLRDWVFALLILVMGISVAVYARRPPREVHYAIDRQGIHINGTRHRFEDFRSFGIANEEAFFSIQLTPLKRFRPAVILFFAEQDGERIVDALGAHIPMQPIKHDIIEQFSRFIRF